MVREIFGLYFDSATGKVFDENGNDMGFTFENRDNPFQFATQETAEKVLSLVRSWVPGASFEVASMKLLPAGGYYWSPRMIRAKSGDMQAEFNAGLLANAVIRTGPFMAKQSFLAEFMTAFKKEE